MIRKGKTNSFTGKGVKVDARPGRGESKVTARGEANRPPQPTREQPPDTPVLGQVNPEHGALGGHGHLQCLLLLGRRPGTAAWENKVSLF